MKKPLQGGKIDLNPASISVKIILWLFLSMSIAAQISLDRLVLLEEYETSAGLNNLFELDFNNDNREDLFLYVDKGDKAAVHFGKDDYSLSEPIEKFVFYPINYILKFNKIYGNQTYLLVSRASRIVSLVSFTDYGTIQILNNHEFDSYPSNLAAGDLDNDGKMEALVCGSNFNGISILSEDDLILRETKLVNNKIFKSISLADFDYDGFVDISAYDIINNGIVIFSNDQIGDFSPDRSITISSSINDFFIDDLESDGFFDMIAYSKNTITLLKGDSVSSFVRIEEKTVKWDIKKLTAADINNDGISDLLYLTDDKLVISYSIEEDTAAYRTHSYLFPEPLIDIRVVGDEKRRILLLSSEGNLFQLKRIENLSDSFRMPFGGKIFYHESETDRNKRISCYAFLLPEKSSAAFMNNYDYYSLFNLNSAYNEVLTAGYPGGIRNIFYREGNESVQMLEFNHKIDLIKSRILRLDYPLLDLEYSKNETASDRFRILAGSESEMLIEEYDFYSGTSADTFGPVAVSDVLAARLLNDRSIIYWNYQDNSPVQIEYDYRSERNISRTPFEADETMNDISEIIAVPIRKGSGEFLLVVDYIESAALFYSKNGSINRIRNLTGIDFGGIQSPDQFEAQTSVNELVIYYNDKIDKSLYRLILDPDEGELTGSKLIESFAVNYYLITKLDNLFYLIYSNKSNTRTNFVRLK